MRLFFFFLGLIFASSLTAEDCSGHIPNFDKPISLKGGWHYMKGDNPDWKEVDTEDSGWVRKIMPDYTKDKEKRPFGFYWYRCHIFLNSETMPTSLGISLGKIRDADEVYWNGSLIGETGKFVPSVQIDTEKDRIYSIPDSLLRNGKNVLAVRVYATTRYYGIRYIPEIGSEWDIAEKNIRGNVLPVVSGFIFVLMGFFFIVGSVVKSPNQSNLLFSLFSIFLGFYTLLRTHFRYEFFSNFTLSYSIELIALFSLPILFVNFLTQYLEVKRNKFTYIYDLAQLALIGFAYFFRTPDRWEILIDLNAGLLIFPSIYVIFLLYKNFSISPKKVRYILIGTIGLFPCVVLDTLRALEFLKIASTLHFGFLFFLINISIQLSEEMVQNYKSYLEQESELVKMERVKTKFIFNVSSEFRSYLDKALIICREIIVGPGTEKEITEQLTKLESLGGLTKSVINDAIVLHSIESGKYEVFTERFSLRTLLNEVISLLKIRHNQDREHINLKLNEDIELQHNKELIFLVFYHLLENEFLYTPADTAIDIQIKDEKNFFTCEIKDNGSGIDSGIDVFKKFVRGNVAVEKDIPGSGIGLTLVNAICEKLNGSLNVSSTPGNGVEIQLVLPIAS